MQINVDFFSTSGAFFDNRAPSLYNCASSFYNGARSATKGNAAEHFFDDYARNIR